MADEAGKGEDKGASEDDKSKDKTLKPGEKSEDKQDDKSGKTYSQSQVDEIMESVRATERKAAEAVKAKADSELKKKEQEALDEQLAKNEEFEKLATERKARIEELEAMLETTETARKSFEIQAAESDKALALHLKAVLDSLKLDDATLELLDGKSTVQQLAWLSKHREKLGSDRKNGIPPGPREDGTGNLSKEDRQRQTVRTW